LRLFPILLEHYPNLSIMKKTTFIITGLFILLQWGCQLEELDSPIIEIPLGLQAIDIVPTNDGAFMICGNYNPTVEGDIFLMKIDKNTNILWYKIDEQLGASQSCNSIVATPDGKFITCGEYQNKAYVAEYDANGKRLRDVIDSETSRCNCIIQGDDVNNRYVFVGRISRPNGTSMIKNAYVGSVNIAESTLIIQPGYVPNPISLLPSELRGIVEHPDGYMAQGFAVVGESSIDPINTNRIGGYFFKINNVLNKNFNSERYYDIGNPQERVFGIIQKQGERRYMLAAKTNNPTGGGGNAGLVMDVPLNGDDEELNYLYPTLPFDRNDELRTIIEANEDNYYIIGGFSTSMGINSEDVYIAKIRENGVADWETPFDIQGRNDRINGIAKTDDGYIAVGQSVESGQHEMIILKINENGDIQ